MENLDQINNIGALKTFKANITAENPRKVSDLLKELKLDNKFFAILVNGKRAALDQNLSIDDNIVLLPRIAGG